MRISAVHLSLLAICSVGIYLDSIGNDAEPGVHEPLASQIMSGHGNNAYGVAAPEAGHDQYFTPVTAVDDSPPGWPYMDNEGWLAPSVANIDDLNDDGINGPAAGTGAGGA